MPDGISWLEKVEELPTSDFCCPRKKVDKKEIADGENHKDAPATPLTTQLPATKIKLGEKLLPSAPLTNLTLRGGESIRIKKLC